MWFFFFWKNERKPFKISHNSLLTIDATNDNSKATTRLLSIKSSKLNEISIFKKSFKLIVIIAFKA